MRLCGIELGYIGDAYLEAAAFTDCGPDAEPDVRGGSWSVEAVEHAAAVERAILAELGDLIEPFDPSQVGHDLWLTRNGHGAGFWDKPELYGESQAKQLTDYAERIGEVCLYAGDDRLLYIE